MQQSKLIDLLKALDEKEWKDLCKYIKRIHPDKNSKHQHFIRILQAQYPSFSSASLDRKQLQLKLFKEKNEDDIKLRRLMSEIYAEVEEYILLLRLQQHPLVRLAELMEFFLDRNLPRQFEMTHESFEEQVDLSMERGYLFYQMKFLAQQKKILFHQRKKNKELKKEDLFTKMNYGDLQFILLRLEEFLVCHSYRDIYGVDIEVTFLDEIIHQIETRKDLIQIEEVQTLYLVTKMILATEKEMFYERLKKFAAKGFPKFEISLRQNLFNSMINYCIFQVNKGNTSYREELFLLYEQLIEFNLLLEDNNQLLPNKMKNVITLALHLGKMAWAENFLNRFRDNLSTDQRDDVYSFNLAKIKFAQCKYDDVITTLSKIDYIDIFYNLSARKLIMQSLYEMRDFDLLSNYTNSFKVFLHRTNTLGPQYLKSNRNFINVFGKLAGNPFKDKSRAMALEKEINSMEVIAERQWLLEKAAQLK